MLPTAGGAIHLPATGRVQQPVTARPQSFQPQVRGFHPCLWGVILTNRVGISKVRNTK